MMESTTSSLETIVITESNLNTGIVHKHNKLINDGNFWHKLVVQNAHLYPRDFVLHTIMDVLYPNDFIPICYTVNDKSVSFLLKNCGPAITELCRLNLTIPHPDHMKGVPAFKFSIVLQYAHAKDLKVEIQANIMHVLKKRYTLSTKTLNLENFHKDADLIEFCPLSQSKLLFYVLHLSKDFKVEILKLGNNNLEVIKGIKAVAGTAAWKGLSNLDLRKNKICFLDQLSVLKCFNITEMNLDENPICDSVSEHEYIKMIKEYCPKLIKLDGLRVSNLGLSFRRNYLCNIEGKDFVDQFLEHYFTLYETSGRGQLEALYHKSAVFSLSSNYLPGQSTSQNAVLKEYKAISRNIKTIVNLSKSGEYLYTGPTQIKTILQLLPKCEHDPYTFTVDLMYYTNTTVIFTVTGVFREPSEKLLSHENICGFSRTFVLMKGNSDEFNIINDQLHVTNATTSQHNVAFKSPVKILKSIPLHLPKAKSENEKEDMINGMMKITNLNYNWSRKFLKECDYDFKRALHLFIEYYKVERIPMIAFRCTDVTIKKITKAIGVQTVQIKTEITSPALGDDQKAASLRINDKVLLSALNIPPTTPKVEAMLRLRNAAEKIIEQYTYCAKYYRALAREYYRFNLFGEARKFLEDAMKNLQRPLSEEVYSTFALMEIQFGDLDFAKKMIKNTAEKYEPQKTVKFIGEHVAKVNVSFARETFYSTIRMNLSPEITQALLTGLKDFEQRYGNVDSMLEVNHLQEEISKGPTVAPSPPPFEIQQQIATEPNNVVLIESDDDHSNDETNSIVDEDKLELFKIFRALLLGRFKIICNPIHIPEEVIIYTENTNSSMVESLGLKLLKSYDNNSDVCWVICEHLWKEEKFTESVFETLESSKSEMNKKTAQFYRIRKDILNGHKDSAYRKVLGYIITSNMNLLTLFENLIWHEPEFAKYALEQSLVDIRSLEKRKLIVMQYRIFAKFLGTKETIKKAKYIYRKYDIRTEFFHPDDVLLDPVCREYREKYESKKNYSLVDLLQFINDHWRNTDRMIEGIRAMYFHKFISKARDVKGRALNILKDGERLRFTLAVVHFDCKFGTTNGLKILGKLDNSLKNRQDVICALVSSYLKIRDEQKSLSLLEELLESEKTLMNPEIQETFWKYYEDWVNYLDNDVLKLGYGELLKQAQS